MFKAGFTISVNSKNCIYSTPKQGRPIIKAVITKLGLSKVPLWQAKIDRTCKICIQPT